MDFRINVDSWFVFSILFIGAMALLIITYVAIPYFSRVKNLKRRNLRHKRKHDSYIRIEEKYSELKFANLQESNQKLKVDLKNDLEQILKSDLKTVNLLPFFSNFEKIYPDFERSLHKIAPEITATELKLCAFLRLNLSSKEISLLLNITPGSVNKGRYRLRKKLGVNSNEDLYVFLSNI